jgi:hypothetical protein
MTWITPGMSKGSFGGSDVLEYNLCSGVLGILCDLGTTNRQASLKRALGYPN